MKLFSQAMLVWCTGWLIWDMHTHSRYTPFWAILVVVYLIVCFVYWFDDLYDDNE